MSSGIMIWVRLVESIKNMMNTCSFLGRKSEMKKRSLRIPDHGWAYNTKTDTEWIGFKDVDCLEVA